MAATRPPSGKSATTVAAEYVLGNLDARFVPWYAADWLAEGHDGPVLRELAGLDDSDPRRNADLLPSALAELKVSVPSAAEAADAWLDDVARQLRDGEISERQTTETVAAFVSANFDVPEIWHPPFTNLYAMDDEWDEGWGRDNTKLAAEVRQLCADRLRREQPR